MRHRPARNRHGAVLATGLLAVGTTACTTEATAEPPVTVVMVSLASVDRAGAIDATLRTVDDATNHRHRVVVLTIDGTATGSTMLPLTEFEPPEAANDVARRRRTAEWAAQVHTEVAAGLDELDAPPLGTTADLAEFVAAGLRQAEALAGGQPSELVVISSGHQATDAALDLDVDPPSGPPTSVWLVGVGDFHGVSGTDRAVSDRAIGRAGAVCGLVAPRPCRVLPSLGATPGSES